MKKEDKPQELLDMLTKAFALAEEQGALFSDYGEENANAFKMIQDYGKDSFDILHAYLDEMQKLREENRRLQNNNRELAAKKDALERKYEDLWKICCEKIDNAEGALSADDIKVLRDEASVNFYSSWDSIEDQSRTMLATALFLYQSTQRTGFDFSPVVVEYCRVFEHEMKRKMFVSFLDDINGQGLLGRGGVYSTLGQAARDERPEKPTVTLKVMVLCLKLLNSSRNGDDVAQALDRYLSTNKWDRRRITEATFTKESEEYADDYRNAAAHPEKIMSEEDARKCSMLTESLVSHFISCMPKEDVK